MLESLLQLPLERLIPPARLRMLPQIVPKIQLAPVAERLDMQMVYLVRKAGGQVALAQIQRPSRHILLHENPAVLLQPPGNRLHRVARGELQKNVDGRLGRQPFDCRAAYMMDTRDALIPQDAQQPLLFLRVPQGILGVVAF